jgi:hypothetical protein
MIPLPRITVLVLVLIVYMYLRIRIRNAGQRGAGQNVVNFTPTSDYTASLILIQFARRPVDSTGSAMMQVGCWSRLSRSSRKMSYENLMGSVAHPMSKLGKGCQVAAA